MKLRLPEKADVRDACVAEAIKIIRLQGLESLSLREVSRRLGISHQAPYKHYPSRGHLMAEVISRAYLAFARDLDARPRHQDPYDDLGEMGKTYLNYAISNPLEYRLMFGTALPDPDLHPEMMRHARHAFDLLWEGIAKLPNRSNATSPRNVDLDALQVWSTLHGFASILKSPVLPKLKISTNNLDHFSAYLFDRIRLTLSE